jgi:hypothetical protein
LDCLRAWAAVVPEGALQEPCLAAIASVMPFGDVDDV